MTVHDVRFKDKSIWNPWHSVDNMYKVLSIAFCISQLTAFSNRTLVLWAYNNASFENIFRQGTQFQHLQRQCVWFPECPVWLHLGNALQQNRFPEWDRVYHHHENLRLWGCDWPANGLQWLWPFEAEPAVQLQYVMGTLRLLLFLLPCWNKKTFCIHLGFLRLWKLD